MIFFITICHWRWSVCSYGGTAVNRSQRIGIVIGIPVASQPPPKLPRLLPGLSRRWWEIVLFSPTSNLNFSQPIKLRGHTHTDWYRYQWTWRQLNLSRYFGGGIETKPMHATASLAHAGTAVHRFCVAMRVLPQQLLLPSSFCSTCASTCGVDQSRIGIDRLRVSVS